MVAPLKLSKCSGRQTPVTTPDDQVGRDRITAVVVLVAFMILMALMFWLASLGNGTPMEPVDWPMM